MSDRNFMQGILGMRGPLQAASKKSGAGVPYDKADYYDTREGEEFNDQFVQGAMRHMRGDQNDLTDASIADGIYTYLQQNYGFSNEEIDALHRRRGAAGVAFSDPGEMVSSMHERRQTSRPWSGPRRGILD